MGLSIDKGKFQAEQFSEWKNSVLEAVENLEKRVIKLEKAAKKSAKAEKAEDGDNDD
jgi:hypothetical protein